MFKLIKIIQIKCWCIKKIKNRQNKIIKWKITRVAKIINKFKKLNKYNWASASSLVKLKVKNRVKNSISCPNSSKTTIIQKYSYWKKKVAFRTKFNIWAILCIINKIEKINYAKEWMWRVKKKIQIKFKEKIMEKLKLENRSKP